MIVFRKIIAFFAILILFSHPVRGAGKWEVRDSVLIIKGGVTDIPSYAFRDRCDFRRIRFEAPVRLQKIGDYAFLGCKELRGIKVPTGVRELGEGCFRECSTMTEIEIPATVIKLPRSLCMWNVALKSVRLPASLEDIGSHAFAYCQELGNIEIPRRVRHIGSNVFSFCSSLREVKVPASVKELESYAFSECVSLERAQLPSNDSLLGELIFSGCRSLVELTINSLVPPKFDCNSFIFEPDEAQLYNQCVLHVPRQSVGKYKGAQGWQLFKQVMQTNCKMVG